MELKSTRPNLIVDVLIWYLHREDAFPTSSVPPIYFPCKRLLTTLKSFTFALAVTIDMDWRPLLMLSPRTPILNAPPLPSTAASPTQLDAEIKVVKHKAGGESGRVGSGEGGNEGEEDAEEFYGGGVAALLRKRGGSS
ncbi:unnamed protein product [Taenia asiatica]|uniref:Uncharacterized protein n=1 Tax=Taenia asiatica TaxID=60517 RepID=A0A0R3WFW7_TAEAS|nr:unnamed protein product [Taenia asiatica]